MARSPRSRASIGTSTPQKEADTDFKIPRSAHNATRRQQYKRAKRAQQVHAVKADIKAATEKSDPAAKKEAIARKAELYRTWKSRGVKKVGELERLVKAQQAEIEELRRLAQAGGVPTLEPVATPRRGKQKAQNAGQVDLSPVKIQQQLVEDVVASPNAEDAEDVLEVEVEESVEQTTAVEESQMDGVEGTTVTSSIEEEVHYPTLPSVEAAEEAAEEVAEELAEELAEHGSIHSKVPSEEPAATKKKSRKEVVRDSSADTNAGTPRNIRRSPRKRAAKRQSTGGA